ncbi:MAG: cysteine hydrolase [Bacilli bacterium]|nr:cysteine hydrolase [Bacilli bacterium]
MLNKKHTAVIVVDMLNDFVTGALGFDGVKPTVKGCVDLLKIARNKDVPVIFTNDSHLMSDPELKIWGKHAIRGTKGAEVIPELKVSKKDYIIPKRRYSGFFQTELDSLLRDLAINEIILCGLHAHMCVRHTAADAYQSGYKVYCATDATNSFTKEDRDSGFKYLQEVYNCTLLNNKEIEKYLSK